MSASVEISLNELVARRHANFISLPEELCASSRPSSPTSEERVSEMRSHMAHLVNLASGDPTNPKWGYVSRFAHLGCTSRGYILAECGVRIGDGRKVNVGKKFKWELPETEEGWEAYQRRWEEAAAAEEERSRLKSKSAAKASKTSKYFDRVTEETEPPSRPSSKAEVVREKVERWQARVVTVAAAHNVPMSPETATSLHPASVEKGKTADKGGKIQVSLGFPVVKRPSATSGKWTSSAPTRPRVPSTAHVPTPPSDGPVPSAPSKAKESVVSDAQEYPQGVCQQPVVAQITEVPELSFLPPSFPSQLQTSTPPLNDKRHKPRPIAPCSPPTSPLSAKSFDAARPKRQDAQQASSSQPLASPLRKPAKRGRPTASPDYVGMNISPSLATARSLLTKRARTDATPQAATQEPASSGSVLVPPSTPPPVSSLPTAPATPVSRSKGLGNAKGLPVPTTPNEHPLPTLTDLLASSRRSRPRPRPPSRKNVSHNKPVVRDTDELPNHETELPVISDNEREPSPTKTYFSSPASGSSGSPGSVAHRPRSPISPLGFTQHPSAFAPQIVSSQRPQSAVDGAHDPFLSVPAPNEGQGQNGGGLMRGSSGFFGMGYSSQFDVEGHVEQVSELLERDVDFDGWLRDLDAEEEGQDYDMSTAAQGESPDAAAVSMDG
ncbi:hypothetical protein DICSQDRAFT_139855 [Dichomitus squalens LYAD-421 SS1]|uniref:Uncharacterized protein n=1 Tax=Dichomitus squalens (strain LYAD-421) TaxID=732165 RepID=R7SPK8_DICSQ|nr:uncharacterized protein DICSQDRAFT_139855 [Dichomitus squalens LYAD-421 SS1]EJF58036.1 hypothetical protein DICSQDRAFT_139855 [Dichomitus squalens LYAD-421 SS1]